MDAPQLRGRRSKYINLQCPALPVGSCRRDIPVGNCFYYPLDRSHQLLAFSKGVMGAVALLLVLFYFFGEHDFFFCLFDMINAFCYARQKQSYQKNRHKHNGIHKYSFMIACTAINLNYFPTALYNCIYFSY